MCVFVAIDVPNFAAALSPTVLYLPHPVCDSKQTIFFATILQTWLM